MFLIPDKNRLLLKERGVSFEEVIAVLNSLGPLDVLTHPNVNKYQNQKIYVVELRHYIYLVPFVESRESIFLKTIFPNRKANKIYGSQEENDE